MLLILKCALPRALNACKPLFARLRHRLIRDSKSYPYGLPLPKSHQCYLYTLDYKVSSLIERRIDFTIYTCFHIFYTRVFNKNITEFCHYVCSNFLLPSKHICYAIKNRKGYITFYYYYYVIRLTCTISYRSMYSQRIKSIIADSRVARNVFGL